MAQQKLLLGSIVVMAGLLKADRAFLLGGLLELAKLEPGSARHRLLRDIGEEAFKARSQSDGASGSQEIMKWP